jgi:ammonia channel protein AmtB
VAEQVKFQARPSNRRNMTSRLLADADAVDNFLKSGGEMDTVWLLFGSILVFFMQTGFAMLEAGKRSCHVLSRSSVTGNLKTITPRLSSVFATGIVSQKNTINVLLKVIIRNAHPMKILKMF